MLNANDPKNIEMYVKETWKAELKVPYDKDFVDDFQFSEYCNKITKKEKKMPHIDPRIFPTILICLDFCASIPYLLQGDIRHFVYWIAAGVLTLTVTW